MHDSSVLGGPDDAPPARCWRGESSRSLFVPASPARRHLPSASPPSTLCDPGTVGNSALVNGDIAASGACAAPGVVANGAEAASRGARVRPPPTAVVAARRRLPYSEGGEPRDAAWLAGSAGGEPCNQRRLRCPAASGEETSAAAAVARVSVIRLSSRRARNARRLPGRVCRPPKELVKLALAATCGARSWD